MDTGSPGSLTNKTMNTTRRTTRPLPTRARSAASAWAALAACAVALVLPARGEAQEWLKDRQASEGPGVRAGDFEFHPAIGAQFGYDSNWFLRTDKAGATNSGVQGSPVMLITPSISLATLGALRREGKTDSEPPPITFRATASGSYHEFFGQLTPEQRNGNANVALNLGILPGRPWGAALSASYDRILQPNVSGNPDLAFNRDIITGSGEIIMQPGSGTLDWHFGGQFSGALFENTGGQGYNNITFGAFTRGRWKFRPKTALLFDAGQGFHSYTAPSTGNITALHTSDPLRARVGINGLLSPRISVLAMAGYGGSFFQPGSSTSVHQYDSVIAQAELKIFLTAPPEAAAGASLSQSTLALGYTRDFENSYLSDFDGLDRGYLKLSYFFAGRALVTLEGGAAAVQYPAFTYQGSNTGETAFTDGRIDATLYGEYRFTNSFALTLTGKYTTNLSKVVLLIPNAATGMADQYAMQWQRIEAMLGMRLFL